MNALNAKVMYSALWMIVTVTMTLWLIPPLLRELGYHGVGIAFKPAWFLGKSRNPSAKTIIGRIRFYNYRRAYTGEHRGIQW